MQLTELSDTAAKKIIRLYETGGTAGLKPSRGERRTGDKQPMHWTGYGIFMPICTLEHYLKRWVFISEETDPAYEQCLEADGVPGIMFTAKILSMLLKYNSEKAKTTIRINQ